MSASPRLDSHVTPRRVRPGPRQNAQGGPPMGRTSDYTVACGSIGSSPQSSDREGAAESLVLHVLGLAAQACQVRPAWQRRLHDIMREGGP
jgi:hypothetical protein